MTGRDPPSRLSSLKNSTETFDQHEHRKHRKDASSPPTSHNRQPSNNEDSMANGTIIDIPRPPLTQAASSRAPKGAYLKAARFRAFQTGVLPASRFASLNNLSHLDLSKSRAQPENKTTGASLPGLIEGSHEAAGHTVPEHVHKGRQTGRQLGIQRNGKDNAAEKLVANGPHRGEGARKEKEDSRSQRTTTRRKQTEKRSDPRQTPRQVSANNSVDYRSGARLSIRCPSRHSSSANTTCPSVDAVRHPTDKGHSSLTRISPRQTDSTGSVGSVGSHLVTSAGKSSREHAPTGRSDFLANSIDSGLQRDDCEGLGYFHVRAKKERLGEVRSVNKESELFAELLPQGLSSILTVCPSTPKCLEARDMAAVKRSRPAMTPERPTTASWDDLISRKHDRRDSLGESVFSENDARRRLEESSPAQPLSTTSDFSMRARPRGRLIDRPSSSGADVAAMRRTDSPGRMPLRPRTMTYHADQRDSSGFAKQMAAMTGNPSPLRTVRTLRSSDSMPELNLGASAEKNSYTTDQRPSHYRSSSRPSISNRPSRLAESITMADLEEAQTPPAPQPVNARARSNPGGRMRAMSWHGKQPLGEPNIFETNPLPSAPMRNSVAGWQRRPEMIKHTRPQKTGPNELFDRLPYEVLGMIMGHLRNLHLERSNSCATCWLRNCCSIAMCNRKWLKAARDALYEDIQLVGADAAQQAKKYKGIYSTRLVLLRRTIRADPKLAALVRFLKVPALPGDAPMEAEAYHDIVASVVMACPNLERLDGYYPTYNHGESRIFNALSSRQKLKEMTWVIDAADPDRERSRAGGHKSKSSKSKNRHSRHQSSVSTTLDSNNYLIAALANKFVRHHMDWSELTHLTIHCLPGAQLHTPNSLLNVIQTYLTSLQSLHLSHVPPQAFNDANLVSLPKPLRKLTLSHCTGVTTAGLSAFATSPSAQNLKTLTLVHQDLDALPAVVRLLANLTRLTTFNLVQHTAPIMPDDELGFLMMPYLGSNSLRFLHWDVFDSATRARDGKFQGTKTDDILARSIAAGGFPNLRFLRVPCDPDGLYQALCRPRERIELPGDRYRNGLVSQASSTTRGGGAATAVRPATAASEKINTVITKPYASSGTLGPYNSSAISLVLPSAASDCSIDGSGRPLSSLSCDDSVKSQPVREAGSDLHQARQRAQARLEAARGFPLFEANITDEEGMLIESTGLAGYLGDVRSGVVYTLAPDVGASDERGGLVGVMDLLSDGGEDLFGKGDAASRSGAGYGTGSVGSEFVRIQTQAQAQAEAQVQAQALAEGTKGKSAKSTKNNYKANNDSLDDGDEGGKKVRDGCTGRWNSYNDESFITDRKISERWWHVERGRWRGRVELS